VTTFVNFFIKRDDGRWYAGTVDRSPVWVRDRRWAAPFKTREQVQRRINGLPNDNDYEVSS
jgi:hypothetical protein